MFDWFLSVVLFCLIDHHPEDVVAGEVEIGANSDISIDERHENDGNTNSLDNNTPSVSNTTQTRRGIE